MSAESKLVPVATKDAPAAIGPYSQAIRTGQFLFLSGQIPLDPVGGTIVGTDVEAQTAQVLKNITAVLKSQGLSLANVVKSTVFLKNMADFTKFNAVYESHLRAPYPARSTVEVARLPKDVLVEIETIAVFPDA